MNKWLARIMFFIMFLAVVYTACQAISSGGSMKHKIDEGVKEREELRQQYIESLNILSARLDRSVYLEEQRYAELESWIKNKGLWKGGYVLGD